MASFNWRRYYIPKSTPRCNSRIDYSLLNADTAFVTAKFNSGRNEQYSASVTVHSCLLCYVMHHLESGAVHRRTDLSGVRISHK